MKKYFIASIACMALTGCVTTDWYKTGANRMERDQAARECEYEAQKATATMLGGLGAGYQQATLKHKCMEVKGYYLSEKRIAD
jgi:hypothetical protein